MDEKLLTIIITHHKEPWEVCKPLIDMLNDQKCVDFNKFHVWIVHDGVPIFPEEYLKGPAHISQVSIPQGGVSAARNFGMDQAFVMDRPTWIQFCDCDDTYTSIYSLANVFYVLESEAANQFDLVWGQFYITWDDIRKRSKSEHFNAVFIHNKYYRLSFLREHNLYFCEDLWMSEDSAFNNVVRMELGENRIGQINVNEPLYAWCRRNGSITMDLDKWLSNTEGHFRRNLYVIQEQEKRGIRKSPLMIARTITDVYSMLTKQPQLKASHHFMKAVQDFFRSNLDLYFQNSSKDFDTALAASDKDLSLSEDDKKNRPTLDNWVRDRLIEKEYSV